MMTDDLPQEVQDLLAKQAIHEVLLRYCRGLDRLDGDLIRDCYHPDATDDHGLFNGLGEDFVPYALPHLETMRGTSHYLLSALIEVHGDTAASESHLVVYHRMPSKSGQETDHVVGLRYIDRFDRRDGVWRISHRHLVYDWSRIDPVGREWDFGEGFTVRARDRSDASYAAFDRITQLREGGVPGA